MQPLEKAVEEGDVELIRQYISEGANIDQCFSQNWTLLHKAAYFRQEEIALYLIDQNADITLKNSYGALALHTASQKGLYLVVEQILKKNIQLANQKDGNGFTALICAAQGGQGDIMQLLLEFESDPNIQDHSGKTCLHYIVEHEKCLAHVFPCLKESGISVDKRNRRGELALHCAASRGGPFACHVLLAEASFVDAKRHDEKTPLHLAIESANIGAVRVLLENNADVKEEYYCDAWRQGKKRSTLYLACTCRNKEVLQVICDYSFAPDLSGIPLNDANVSELFLVGATLNGEAVTREGLAQRNVQGAQCAITNIQELKQALPNMGDERKLRLYHLAIDMKEGALSSLPRRVMAESVVCAIQPYMTLFDRSLQTVAENLKTLQQKQPGKLKDVYHILGGESEFQRLIKKGRGCGRGY